MQLQDLSGKRHGRHLRLAIHRWRAVRMAWRKSIMLWLALGLVCAAPGGFAQEPAKPISQPITLAMSAFFQSPVGPQGLQISDALRQAQGRLVRLRAYMVQQEQATAGAFYLSPRPVLMSQHADGQADDLAPSTVLVLLPEELQDWVVAYTRGLVEVVGVLELGRQEGPDGRVSWVRLQLDKEATRRMHLAEWMHYRHAMQHLH